MVICFTQPIWNVGDFLHLVLPPLQCRPPHLMGINLGTYSIRDGCGFRLYQAIRDVEQGNYDLMLLTEKNILDAVYCHNHMGYDVV